jgi:hypothetical protein
MNLQWVRWLVNSSAAAVAALALYLSLVQGKWWNLVGFFVLACLLYVPHWLYYGVPGFTGSFRPRLVQTTELVLTSLLLLNVVGYLGLFNSYFLGFGYDTFMHFFGKLLALVLLAIVYTGYRWHRYRQGTTLRRLLWVIVIGGAIIGFGWELFEWGTDGHDGALGDVPLFERRQSLHQQGSTSRHHRRHVGAGLSHGNLSRGRG